MTLITNVKRWEPGKRGGKAWLEMTFFKAALFLHLTGHVFSLRILLCPSQSLWDSTKPRQPCVGMAEWHCWGERSSALLKFHVRSWTEILWASAEIRPKHWAESLTGGNVFQLGADRSSRIWPVGQEYGIKTANTCQQSSENVPISKLGEMKRIKVKLCHDLLTPHVILNLMNPYASLFHTEKSQKPNTISIVIIYKDSSHPKIEKFYQFTLRGKPQSCSKPEYFKSGRNQGPSEIVLISACVQTHTSFITVSVCYATLFTSRA